jgi:hypothetical protein
MRAMNVIDKLRAQGKMTWIDEEQGWIADEEHGWIAAPEDIVDGESVAHGRTLDLEPNPYTENGGES